MQVVVFFKIVSKIKFGRVCICHCVCVCMWARARACMCVCEREREGERNRDRQRDRERRDRERQTNRQTETETLRQTGGEERRQTETEMHPDVVSPIAPHLETSSGGPSHRSERPSGDAMHGRNVPHLTFEPRSEESTRTLEAYPYETPKRPLPFHGNVPHPHPTPPLPCLTASFHCVCIVCVLFI